MRDHDGPSPGAGPDRGEPAETAARTAALAALVESRRALRVEHARPYQSERNNPRIARARRRAAAARAWLRPPGVGARAPEADGVRPDLPAAVALLTRLLMAPPRDASLRMSLGPGACDAAAAARFLIRNAPAWPPCALPPPAARLAHAPSQPTAKAVLRAGIAYGEFLLEQNKNT